MKKNAKVAVAIVGLLILTAAGFYRGRVSGASVYGTPETIAYTRKDTSAELGTSANPFTVLEIVPDESMAAVGYLIPGCEPVEQLETDVTGAMTQYKTIFAGDNGIASVTDEDMRCFRGDFPESLGFDASYIENNLTQDNTGDYFKQYGYFEHVEQDNGKYKYDTGQFLSVAVDDDASQVTYRWVPLRDIVDGASTDLVDNITVHLPENNLDVVMEEDEIGTTNDVVGSRFYVERCESRYVSYAKNSITHTDALIKTIFPGNATADGFVSQVVTVTPSQLSGDNVKEGIIQEADMMVIHDSAVAQPINNQAALPEPPKSPVSYDVNNELSAECYEAIIKRQASGNPAMMWLDESAMDECVTNPSHLRARYEIEKLYAIMNKYGAKYFYNVYCPDENGRRELDPDANGGEAFAYTGHTTGLHRGQFSYVLNWGGEDTFLTKTWDETTLMAMDNFYAEAKGEGQKKPLRILELQPIAKFIYGNEGWKQYYLSLFPWYVGSSANIEEDIQVTTMATYEFNGKIEDLNATYDLIIIGGSQDATNGLYGYNDAALGNVAYATVGDLVSTDDDYAYFVDGNFFALDGNIGGNWGDFYRKNKLHWISDKLEAWGGWAPGKDYNFLASEQGTDISQCGIRYSATDITSEKYQELLEFSQKNPIVVADKLYTADGADVDKEFVDESSYIYNIAKLGLGTEEKVQQIQKYANVIDNNLEDYRKSLEKKTCEMEFLEDGMPVAYAVTEQVGKTVRWRGGQEVLTDIIAGTKSNNQKDDAGNNILQYHFKLHGEEGRNHRVRLYIDSNGNGAFEDAEGVDDSLLISATDGDVTGAVENGQLQGNRNYKVTRTLPTTVTGMLPWKLVIYGTENASIRDSRIGYTRIAGSGQKETIKILQMDLSPNMTNKNPSIRLDDVSTEIGAKFAAYLNDIEDYEVSIEYKTNAWFTNNYKGSAEKEARWVTDLQEYDMLILGFDVDPVTPTFTNDEVFMQGFQAFVEAGKSVIMTHDLIQDKSFSKTPDWTIDADKSAYLRQLCGQMQMYSWNDAKRPSYSQVYSRGKRVNLLPQNVNIGYLHERWFGIGGWNTKAYMTEEDYTYAVPGTKDKICNLMDNSIRTMIFSSRQGNKIDREIVSPKNGNTAVNPTTLDWISGCETTTIKLANQGQITNYPYQLGDTLEVGLTHAQNFRLSLEPDESSAFNSHFSINGRYQDWDNVPMTEGSWYQQALERNSGALVYEDGVAYGYAKVREVGSANRNGGPFTSMQVTLQQEDGVTQDYQVKYITIAEDGTINLNPQLDNLAPGSYTYQLASVGFSSTHINELKTNPYWNDDMIWGEMKMVITDGEDEAEYRLDVDAIAKWNRQNPIDTKKISNVTSCLYGISSPQGTPPTFQSVSTNDFVVSLPPVKEDEAIVWYNLSNDANDATNIYSAKEGDSANNYYLYTKGNVTYTGLGHSGKMTNDEIKLFVNTLISSYRSQAAAPYVKVLNEDAIHNGSICTLYTEDRGEDTKSVTVKFLIGDDSVDTTAGKQYRFILKDEGGNVVKSMDFINKDDVISYEVTTEELKQSAKTYSATLNSTYQVDGREITTESTMTVRVMLMPLFALE